MTPPATNAPVKVSTPAAIAFPGRVRSRHARPLAANVVIYFGRECHPIKDVDPLRVVCEQSTYSNETDALIMAASEQSGAGA